MAARQSHRRPALEIEAEVDEDATVDALAVDGASGDDEVSDDLSDSGVDLTEASELDADNVLADEESTRVQQAPD